MTLGDKQRQDLLATALKRGGTRDAWLTQQDDYFSKLSEQSWLYYCHVFNRAWLASKHHPCNREKRPIRIL
jgi:hypothetical protein